MKKHRHIVLSGLLMVAACASQPQPQPSTATSPDTGSKALGASSAANVTCAPDAECLLYLRY